MSRTVPPIEAESYRILRSTVDTSELAPRTRDVVERVVHATADLDYLTDLVCAESALAAGAEALAASAPLVVDAAMVGAGITTRASLCLVGDLETAALAAAEGITRSAAGFRLAAERAADGAVWVVGVAPTALFELLRLAEAGAVRPALVVGVPVGFVGAAESKAALRESGLPSVSNLSAKGGAGVAAAAVNALLYGDPLAAAPNGENA
ncbi:MAG: precorrin-8X methylmutase [Micromonosporaceae bacterium]